MSLRRFEGSPLAQKLTSPLTRKALSGSPVGARKPRSPSPGVGARKQSAVAETLPRSPSQSHQSLSQSPLARRSSSPVTRFADAADHREQAARVVAQRITQHEVAKSKLLAERERVRQGIVAQKKERREEWKRKLDKSPFLINLVAESERVEEEQRLKRSEEARRARELELKKEKVKQDIIVKVLSETADMEAIRTARKADRTAARSAHSTQLVAKASSRQRADPLARQRHDRQAHSDDILAEQTHYLTLAEEAASEHQRQAILRQGLVREQKPITAE